MSEAEVQENNDTPQVPIHDVHAFVEFCQDTHPANVVDGVRDMEAEEFLPLLLALAPKLQAGIFSHLPEEQQVALAELLTREQLAMIVGYMSPDERTDIFHALPDETQERLFPILAKAQREDLRRLGSYEEGTAGSVMTSDYATLSAQLTAREAIEKLRLEAPDKETIYHSYVLDDQRHLLGVVSLKDLILARPDALIENLMRREVIYSRSDADQEEVARKIAKYDLIALPIVDATDMLVGIVTYDDVIDILQQEHTEDVERLMAISGSHETTGYLRATAWSHFRRRVYWVVGLAVAGLLSGMIIHSFEDTLTAMMVLALYMPMVADTGGNTGAQSATVIIRALTIQDVQLKDGFKILFKEFQVAILLAIVLAILAFAKVMYLSQGAEIPEGFALPRVAMVIASALGAQVVSSTLIGAILPLAAAKLKLDPAVVAAPALTTIVDITGLLIYFTIAKNMFGI